MTEYLGPEWDEKVRRNREWMARYKTRQTAGLTASREPRPHQLRHDSTVRRAIASALDTALAQHPERAAEARRARHWADFNGAWAKLGYRNDPAEKRRTFAEMLPQIEAGCARIEAESARIEARAELATLLAAYDWKRERERRLEAARRLGRAQGRALAFREHFAAMAIADGALAADLDAAAERAPKHRYFRFIEMTGGLS